MIRKYKSLNIQFSIIFLEIGDIEEIIFKDTISLRHFTIVVSYAKQLSFNKYTVVGLGIMKSAESLKDAESKIMEYYK